MAGRKVILKFEKLCLDISSQVRCECETSVYHQDSSVNITRRAAAKEDDAVSNLLWQGHLPRRRHLLDATW